MTLVVPEKDQGHKSPFRRPAQRARLSRSSVAKVYAAAADVVAIASGMALAFGLREFLPGKDVTPAVMSHMWLGLLSLPLWVGVFAQQKLYAARYIGNRIDEFRRLVRAVGTGVFATAALGFALKIYAARLWLVLTFVFVLMLVLIEREATRRDIASLRQRGHLLRQVVIVGRNAQGLALAEMFAVDPSLGYHVVGFVDDSYEGDERAHLFDRPILGRIADTLDVVREVGASGVVIATSAVDMAESNRLTRELTDAGIHVELSSPLRDIAVQRLSMRALGRFPVVYVEPVRRNGWRAAAKRTYDVVLAAGGLVLLSPLLLVIAVSIKLTSRGPVLFRQERVGQGAKPFGVLKFRTMVEGAERIRVDLTAGAPPIENGHLFKPADDPRLTKVGRILRKFSLDELPQLWNVLRGEMSLVGPRPALASEMAMWSPELHNRLRVRPGITGMWQVGRRSDWSFDDYMRLDLYYVDNWSLWTDLAISAKTVPMLLFGRGNR